MSDHNTNPTAGQYPIEVAYVLGHMAGNDHIAEDLARQVLAVVADNHPEEDQIDIRLYFDLGWDELYGPPSERDVLAAFDTIRAEIAQARAKSDPAPVDLEVWGWINDL